MQHFSSSTSEKNRPKKRYLFFANGSAAEPQVRAYGGTYAATVRSCAGPGMNFHEEFGTIPCALSVGAALAQFGGEGDQPSACLAPWLRYLPSTAARAAAAVGGSPSFFWTEGVLCDLAELHLLH